MYFAVVLSYNALFSPIAAYVEFSHFSVPSFYSTVSMQLLAQGMIQM